MAYPQPVAVMPAGSWYKREHQTYDDGDLQLGWGFGPRQIADIKQRILHAARARINVTSYAHHGYTHRFVISAVAEKMYSDLGYLVARAPSDWTRTAIYALVTRLVPMPERQDTRPSTYDVRVRGDSTAEPLLRSSLVVCGISISRGSGQDQPVVSSRGFVLASDIVSRGWDWFKNQMAMWEGFNFIRAVYPASSEYCTTPIVTVAGLRVVMQKAEMRYEDTLYLTTSPPSQPYKPLKSNAYLNANGKRPNPDDDTGQYQAQRILLKPVSLQGRTGASSRPVILPRSPPQPVQWYQRRHQMFGDEELQLGWGVPPNQLKSLQTTLRMLADHCGYYITAEHMAQFSPSIGRILQAAPHYWTAMAFQVLNHRVLEDRRRDQLAIAPRQ